MKKIAYVLLVLALIFALVSCESDPIFSTLTSLAAKDYGMVKVNVVTSVDGAKLNSSYKVTSFLVSYSVEVLSELTLDGDEEFKEIKTGEATVVNGEITSFDGDAVTLPEYSVLKGKFNFKSANLKNVVLTENTLTASVVNLGAFLGTETSGTAARIKVEFDVNKITRIEIEYIESGANVKATYEFI